MNLTWYLVPISMDCFSVALYLSTFLDDYPLSVFLQHLWLADFFRYKIWICLQGKKFTSCCLVDNRYQHTGIFCDFFVCSVLWRETSIWLCYVQLAHAPVGTPGICPQIFEGSKKLPWMERIPMDCNMQLHWGTELVCQDIRVPPSAWTNEWGRPHATEGVGSSPQ